MKSGGVFGLKGMRREYRSAKGGFTLSIVRAEIMPGVRFCFVSSGGLLHDKLVDDLVMRGFGWH